MSKILHPVWQMTRKNPENKCFQEILQEAQLNQVHPTVDLALNFHK
jgi:hypothetical protein